MQEQSTKNSMSSIDFDFITAQNLIASGNLGDAESLLRKKEEQFLSVESLDLLARIAVQKGQHDQAGQLWKSVLKNDPANEAAKSALKRLDSSWVAVALFKRFALMAGILVIIFLSVVGLFALFNGDRQSQPQSVTSTDKSSQVKVTSSLNIPGCSIYADKGETKIVFNDGLFNLCCNLKDSAREQIADVARLLQDNVPNGRIIIEGHTDSSSMRKNNLYKDNYDLGFMRALTVARILQEKYKIDGKRILITSMGDKIQPFQEKDNESKSKNRTIVIRLL